LALVAFGCTSAVFDAPEGAAAHGAASELGGSIEQGLGSTLAFQPGDGERAFAPDVCDDRASDYPRPILLVSGFASSEALVTRDDAQTLRIEFPDTGDVARLRLWAPYGEDCARGVAEVRFSDGTTWRTAQRASEADALPFYDRITRGGEGAARLRGDRGKDALVGGRGDEILYGYEERDLLVGAAGNDVLYGYEGDDTLIGGLGDDDLYGDAGDDTYVFRGAFGRDIVDDDGGRDTFVFVDVTSSSVRFERRRDDLVVHVDAARRVRVRDFFYARRYEVEAFRFADGITRTASDVARLAR
jgi:hypothetical protein